MQQILALVRRHKESGFDDPVFKQEARTRLQEAESFSELILLASAATPPNKDTDLKREIFAVMDSTAVTDIDPALLALTTAMHDGRIEILHRAKKVVELSGGSIVYRMVLYDACEPGFFTPSLTSLMVTMLERAWDNAGSSDQREVAERIVQASTKVAHHLRSVSVDDMRPFKRLLELVSRVDLNRPLVP